MELLQSGVVAALAATGLTTLLWLAASLLYREAAVAAVYLVPVSGDGAGLDVTLRRLHQNRRLPVLLVDCGLTAQGLRAVELLAGPGVRLVTPGELSSLYVEQETD